MGEWTAILLAGQRPGEDGFAAANHVAAKALIPVGGEPMLGRVARTLLAAPSVGRILVLAQQPDALFAGDLAWMAAEPRIGAAAGGEGISSSIAAIAGAPGAPFPLLVATADHPLLSAEMIETFIAGAAGSDAAFAVVERAVVERAHVTKRTWIKFSDGHYTGANLFALATPAARGSLAVWGRAEKDRKRALKLLSFFGPEILLRAFTRTIGMENAVAKIGRKLGIRLTAVRLPYAEAAIDVDKPSDLELVEQIVAARASA